MDPTSPYRRIIFIDWHGVVSTTPFWASILYSNTHPLRYRLRDKVAELFFRKAYVQDWMRGAISAAEVISDLNIHMDRRFRPDFLARRLHADCARMIVNIELLEALLMLAPKVPIVLATDNMDCFAHVLASARSRPTTRHPRQPELRDWAGVFADVLCSSDIGTLKAEDTRTFFGTVLSAYGLGFSEALLIDDRADGCEAFRRCGGCALQWRTGVNRVSEAVAQTRHWLGADQWIS
jgi:hypothetical protein